MKIIWSKHSEDWVKLSYDIVKIVLSLVIFGPLMTQQAVNPVYLAAGSLIVLAFITLAVYIKERG